MPAGPGAASLIAAHHPAAVIFDRCLAEPDFTLALLDEQPDLILVGVDPSSNKVFVLSGREEQPASPAELLRALVNWVASPTAPAPVNGNPIIGDRPGRTARPGRSRHPPL